MRAGFLAVALIACGDDDSGPSPRDAPRDMWTTNAGFGTPTLALAAWSETSPGAFTEEQLDLGCLGAARNDSATTVAVSVTVTVRDFQSGNLVPLEQVAAFSERDPTRVIATGQADSTGKTTLSIPSGTTRFGLALTGSSFRPTYTYDELLAPTIADQALTVTSVSNATVATLPALVGVLPLPDTAVVFAGMRDCRGHLVSNFVATASTTPSIPAHASNVNTYYFSESARLPVRQQAAWQGGRDGHCMIVDVPPLPLVYLQMWGFRDGSELVQYKLTQVAELALPILANTIVDVELEPRAYQR